MVVVVIVGCCWLLVLLDVFCFFNVDCWFAVVCLLLVVVVVVDINGKLKTTFQLQYTLPELILRFNCVTVYLPIS